ncbi:MAG TPA: DMT family transporter [Dyella sp.]|nr:DMT family transporter [Dyella sp.]
MATMASAMFGAGDFFGGVASRRTDARLVVLVAMVAGLAPLAAVIVAEGSRFNGVSAFWSVIAGLGFAAGVSLLYRALSQGRMLQVAPITAIIAIAIPTVVDMAYGNAHVHAKWLVGILAALASGTLLGAARNESGARADLRTIGMALLAGSGFGLFYVGLKRASIGNEDPWTVLGIRFVAVIATMIAALGTPRATHRTFGLAVAIVAGVFDGAATVLLMIAFSHGGLAGNSAIASLYPATTMLLAILFLKERPTFFQSIGLAMALPAVLLLQTT